MKCIARLLATTIGSIIGAILWLFLYTSFFGPIQFNSLSSLLLKLSPGIVIGIILAFYVPNLFLWLLGWSYDGDIECADSGLTENALDKSNSSKSNAEKNT